MHQKSNSWFRFYLVNRTQICRVEGALSEASVLSLKYHKALQLAQMLFLLYVDDLANCLNVVFAKIFAHARHNKHLGKELYRAPTNFNSDLITESCPFLRANTKIKFMVHCNWFSAKKKKTKKTS